VNLYSAFIVVPHTQAAYAATVPQDATWIEAKNRSTNRGSLHWRRVVQQWSDPQTWIKIVDRSTVAHAHV